MKAATHHAAIGTAKGLRLLDGGATDLLDGAPITSIHADGSDLWVLVGRRDLHRVTDGAAEFVTRTG